MYVKNREGQKLGLAGKCCLCGLQKGCPVYLVIFIDVTDITELREMQKKLTEQTVALQNALEEAEKANMAKADFLSKNEPRYPYAYECHSWHDNHRRIPYP